MIFILMLVAGLILDLAGPHWFSGAHTVGVILTVVGGVFVVLQVIMMLGAVSLFKR